jgi:hypothetical protein
MKATDIIGGIVVAVLLLAVGFGLFGRLLRRRHRTPSGDEPTLWV